MAAKSPLIQLDRSFDYIVPDEHIHEIRIGQEVVFPLGRSKKPQVGFVTQTLDESEFATTSLLSVSDNSEVLPPSLAKFLRQVADRQCVALGELLGLAIPDRMTTIEKLQPLAVLTKPQNLIEVNVVPPLTAKSAVLTSARAVNIDGSNHPDWAVLIATEAIKRFSNGLSCILIAPEKADIDCLESALGALGFKDALIMMRPGSKKSTRYQNFHLIKDSQAVIVVGTRSAIYAPVQNLGLVALHDDLDDSLRDQGSPFTHSRELALMRATDGVALLFTAPYRSVEIERLVSIGHMSEHRVVAKPIRISYTEPGIRMDQSAFQLVKEYLEAGVVLVLLPRKGDSAAVYCGGCGDKLSCSCGGYMWQPDSDTVQCRICRTNYTRCTKCESRSIKKGRTGSARTVSELGKTFPNIFIAEAAGGKKLTGLKQKNQLVIATPGSAPRLKQGYAAVLVLDCDVWLSRQSLNAQQLALRDWMETFDLMAEDGRAILSGIGSELGTAVSLGKLIPLAQQALREAKELNLPPASRICTLEATGVTLEAALEAAKSQKGEVIRADFSSGTALIRFSFNQGAAVAKSLRAVAVGATARTIGNTKRRGLRVVMDDARAL